MVHKALLNKANVTERKKTFSGRCTINDKNSRFAGRYHGDSNIKSGKGKHRYAKFSIIHRFRMESVRRTSVAIPQEFRQILTLKFHFHGSQNRPIAHYFMVSRRLTRCLLLPNTGNVIWHCYRAFESNPLDNFSFASQIT